MKQSLFKPFESSILYFTKSKYTIRGVAFSMTSSVVKVHFDFIFPIHSFYTIYVMWRHFTTFKSRINLLNNFWNKHSTEYIYLHTSRFTIVILCCILSFPQNALDYQLLGFLESMYLNDVKASLIVSRHWSVSDYIEINNGSIPLYINVPLQYKIYKHEAWMVSKTNIFDMSSRWNNCLCRVLL